MEMSTKMHEFTRTLISRGLGMYGPEKMQKICSDSGFRLDDDGSFEKNPEADLESAVQKLLINYSKFNLPAKMTAMVLAKKYNIKIPEALQKKRKRKSRFRHLFERTFSS
ncbi:MAG: hypothetical protein GF308_17835 [Candidatus Heimdallarchaeota archaeon]|nr:hypothetical protein [Candidatus Heimdallarchaeota archaeon]